MAVATRENLVVARIAISGHHLSVCASTALEFLLLAPRKLIVTAQEVVVASSLVAIQRLHGVRPRLAERRSQSLTRGEREHEGGRQGKEGAVDASKGRKHLLVVDEAVAHERLQRRDRRCTQRQSINAHAHMHGVW